MCLAALLLLELGGARLRLLHHLTYITARQTLPANVSTTSESSVAFSQRCAATARTPPRGSKLDVFMPLSAI